MSAPTPATGWGVVDRFGDLWASMYYYRADAQAEVARTFNKTWRQCYRWGFRTIRVRLEHRYGAGVVGGGSL